MSQTIPVRKGEELNLEVIKQYLETYIENFPSDEIKVQQFPAGKSNLTYTIQCGEWEGVLRRPPFGPLPPKAHDMEREFEVLKKLHSVYPLVPRPYSFCSDNEVIGAPFYVMERVKGITLDDEETADQILTFEDRQHISQLMVDAMVDLHQADYQKAGLEGIGYPTGFLERQLKNWIGRYHKYKTEDVEAVDNIIKWLNAHIPPPQKPTFIHNDFKLNNVLISEDLKRINAVLDWEMATIGDPLFDLGATLSYWIEENDSNLIKTTLPSPTALSGFINRREFLEKYAKRTGRDVSSFQFYLTLAYFKIGVAVQQIYYRYATGQTKDERFANYNENAKNIILYAETLTSQKNIV